MDDPEPEWHRQAAAVNLVSLSDGVTPGRQGNGVEGWDNNNHIIYKINMYKYIYMCVCVPVLQKYAIEHKNHPPSMQMVFLGDLLLLFLPTSNVTCS
jgi:hypothetical protein